MSQICDRCGSPTDMFKMSYFNTETICEECETLDELHPEYHAAKEAEREQVENGNYNYEGIGLPVGYREWARAKKAELATSPEDLASSTPFTTEEADEVFAILEEFGSGSEDE